MVLSKASVACDFSLSKGQGAQAAKSKGAPGAGQRARHLSLRWQHGETGGEAASGEVEVTRTHAGSPSDAYLRHHL